MKRFWRDAWITLCLVAPSLRFSEVLPGLPDPIESLGFGSLACDLPPLLLMMARHCLWQQPGLLDQVEDDPANQFEYIHKIQSKVSPESTPSIFLGSAWTVPLDLPEPGGCIQKT